MAARAGEEPERTQASVAVSGDGQTWFLINASPDLRAQMRNTRALHPPAKGKRGTPVAGVLLTSADLDHTLGLLLLREHDHPITVYATAEVRTRLGWLDQRLRAPFCGLAWREVLDSAPFPLLPAPDGSSSGLTCQCHSFSKSGTTGATAAFLIHDEKTDGRLLVAPDIAAHDDQLLAWMDEADVVLADGTFWSMHELGSIAPGKRPADQMGHLPLDSGGLAALRGCRARTKVLIHINNTNPILTPGSAPRAAVEESGVAVGIDGMTFQL